MSEFMCSERTGQATEIEGLVHGCQTKKLRTFHYLDEDIMDLYGKPSDTASSRSHQAMAPLSISATRRSAMQRFLGSSSS